MTTVRLVQENITRECDTQEPIGPSKISGEEVLNRPSAKAMDHRVMGAALHANGPIGTVRGLT